MTKKKFGVQGAGAVPTYLVKGLCTLDLDLQFPGFFVHQTMAVRYAVTLSAVKPIHKRVRYSVDYKDFFYGNLIVDGKFNAKSKSYYKRARNIFGSKLVIEKLENGVDIDVEVSTK